MELEQIEGTVEDIIYENPDNGYTVFEISGGGTVTVVCGIVGELHAGESVVCRGKYENHATYGRQFHAQECETDMPKDLEAVYAFLASGSLPYIGARTANKIIDKFGAAALEVIANDPAQLTLIPGMGTEALAALEDQEHVRRTVENNAAGMRFYEQAFRDMGLEWIPSQGNFILVKVGQGKKVFNDMLAKGVIVRAQDGYGLPEWIRISIGTPAENARCVEVLKEVL